jgi:hypothetical protein
MNNDTRKLLKIFGVAITDSEAEAEKLIARALQLSTNSNEADTMNTAQEKP